MNINKLPNIIPIFPLSGALLLPNGNLPLNIFEPRYIEMIDYAMKTDKIIGMIQENPKNHKDNRLYNVGCLGKITQYNETEDGRYLINLNGIIRYKLLKEENSSHKFRKLKVDYSDFKKDLNRNFEDTFDKNKFLDEAKIYLSKNNIHFDWNTLKNVGETILITSLASICPFSVAEKQMILECIDIDDIPKTILSLFKMSYEQSDLVN